ncbi:pyridoxamine 5'-phosphate oxidase [Streptomyces sp. NPDC051976]|uniref:pyridoxamine 5'-phosphate oxidase family protein n=1 Tax=Streptomyces sp. NPDC051976 TaxID=3154947 RepID=UPI0034245A70
MSEAEGPRSREERKRDALHRLEHDPDVWVATADPQGVPCLMPLFFWWDGSFLWLSTRPTNPSGANMAGTGTALLCLGTTRDVVHIEGAVTAFTAGELPEGVADAFTAKGDWDPRESPQRYDWYRVEPRALRAWGTVPELAGRLLMRDGQWLV